MREGVIDSIKRESFVYFLPPFEIKSDPSELDEECIDLIDLM